MTDFFNDYARLMDNSNTLVKSANNPFYKSKYADLNCVLDEARRLCAECNFIFIQFPTVQDCKNYLQTELIHTGGTKVTSLLELVSKDSSDPQKLGSAITYCRRYSLVSLLGLQQDDDDGNNASKPVKIAKKEQPKLEPTNEELDQEVTKTTGTKCPKCGEKATQGALENWNMCLACKNKENK